MKNVGVKYMTSIEGVKGYHITGTIPFSLFGNLRKQKKSTHYQNIF